MKNNFNKFNLENDIYKALFNMGYLKPSTVQNEVIPKLLNNENVVVKSKTGSGKTASFAIPICQKIDINKNSVQALIIVPTRELAIQVKDEISNIGRFKKIRCSAIFGKQSIKDQIFELKQRVHIVVATPGRIIDHINRGTIDLNNLKYFVIDEADKMLNKGFVDDMKFIFDKINNLSIIGLFSATMGYEIGYICDKYIGSYNFMDIKDSSKYQNKIDEKIIYSDEKNKYENLKNIIYNLNPDTTIIFLNTKERVSKLYDIMKKDKFLVKQLHGDMSQSKRIFAINDLKNGKYNILISTDIASRGIHIDDISLVINYDVPRDKENYIHRVGRTGRKESFGKAITMVCDNEKKYLDEIKKYTNHNIDEINELNLRMLDNAKSRFEQKSIEILKSRKIRKEDKNVHQEIIKIQISGGKKKKIRTIDIVGAFSNLEGIDNSDIGVIEIHDLYSYVDLLNYKGENFLKRYKQISVKKKLLKVRKK